MENISLKLEKEFLKIIETVMKKHNYMTKTEFIREAIREKIKVLEGKDSSVSGMGTGGGKAEKREPPSYI